MWVLSLNGQYIHLWKCKTAVPQNRGFPEVKKDKLSKKGNKLPCLKLNCTVFIFFPIGTLCNLWFDRNTCY